jgi:hypothetical protein
MLTNIACYIIISFFAASQLFMGAYINTMHEMVEEYRAILSLSLAELSQYDIRSANV